MEWLNSVKDCKIYWIHIAMYCKFSRNLRKYVLLIANQISVSSRRLKDIYFENVYLTISAYHDRCKNGETGETKALASLRRSRRDAKCSVGKNFHLACTRSCRNLDFVISRRQLHERFAGKHCGVVRADDFSADLAVINRRFKEIGDQCDHARRIVTDVFLSGQSRASCRLLPG